MGIPHLRTQGAFDTVRAIAYRAISSYAQVGADITNGESIRLLILTNSMDVAAQISFDGTNEHIRLLPGATLTLDMATLEVFLQKGSTVVEVHAKELSTSAEGNVTVAVLK